MLIYSPDRKVAYQHIPKTGSRTMLGIFSLIRNKNLIQEHPEYFKEVPENNYQELRKYVADYQENCRIDVRYVHEVRPTSEYVICLMRDPIARFVSGYTNRVLFYDMLKTGEQKPSISEFIDNFFHYYATNKSIYEHFRPQIQFLGTDPSIFTDAFTTERFDLVFSFFESLYGDLPRFALQRGGSEKRKEIELSQEEVDFLKSFYSEDYKLLEQFSKKGKLWKR